MTVHLGHMSCWRLDSNDRSGEPQGANRLWPPRSARDRGRHGVSRRIRSL